MILFIFSLTLRQLISRKSALIPLGLACLPVLVAVVFRLSDPAVDPERWAARVLMVGLIVTAVLPLTALFFGSSVLGDELEDGTAIYLLTKPLARWEILLPKLAAAAFLTVVLVLLSTAVSGIVTLNHQADFNVIRGFVVAVSIGSVAYATVFVLLSLVTSRALIAGLVYVFIWEALVADIFAGTRYLSIRHYTLGIADAVADVRPAIFEADIGGLASIILVIATTVLAALYANRRLEQVEVRESS